MARVWAVTIGESDAFVFDLPVEVFEEMAKRHGVGWLSIVDDPMQSPGVAKDVVMAIAKMVGSVNPEIPSARTLHGMFHIKDDDLPAVLLDGIPNDLPDPETTGSSGP